jgi:hypothetical protein
LFIHEADVLQEWHYADEDIAREVVRRSLETCRLRDIVQRRKDIWLGVYSRCGQNPIE